MRILSLKNPGGFTVPDQAGHEWWQQTSGPSGREGQSPGVLPPNGPGATELPESPAAPERRPTGSDRSWWKKYRTAIILGAISLVLFLITAGLYPSTTQLPVPLSSTLALQATQQIASITYEVDQTSSSVAEMKITILLPVGASIPPG